MPGMGMNPLKPAAKKEGAAGPPVPSKTYSLEELKKVPAGVEKSRIVVSPELLYPKAKWT